MPGGTSSLVAGTAMDHALGLGLGLGPGGVVVEEE